MNWTALTAIATATPPRRIHLIILRLSVKYGYMEIMMRAVIAFQLTIGKRWKSIHPVLFSPETSLYNFKKKNMSIYFPSEQIIIKFRFLRFILKIRGNLSVSSFPVDLNLLVYMREEVIGANPSFKPFYLARNTAV